MLKRDWSAERRLNLKAGEWIEVRSRDEILATLDERGRLDNLPFMPEMLAFCGKRFRVVKRADKTCDNIAGWSIRRVYDAVHLENGRCDGGCHDGCEAGCLIFWKEAWLKRAEEPVRISVREREDGASRLCTVESLFAASRAGGGGDGTPVYRCQATNLLEFTAPMRAWDPRQYVRDIRSGNLTTGLAGHSKSERVIDTALAALRIAQALAVDLFNAFQKKRHGIRYPEVQGASKKTPLEVLDLRPGEFVQVRSREEILATLDASNRNRGLLFDSEMLRYCGGVYRVLRRVHRIIDEKTGRMLEMKNPCIVLEGVACAADYHRFCPRAIYHYWRENWLRRAAEIPLAETPTENSECGASEREGCMRAV